jgi:hypothetical protein
MGAQQMIAHPFRMGALPSFVGRLIELARGIESNSALHAPSQQVEQPGRVALRIELRANLVVGINRIFAFPAPELVVLPCDPCRVLENPLPQPDERFQGIADDVRRKPRFRGRG